MAEKVLINNSSNYKFFTIKQYILIKVKTSIYRYNWNKKSNISTNRRYVI